ITRPRTTVRGHFYMPFPFDATLKEIVQTHTIMVFMMEPKTWHLLPHDTQAVERLARGLRLSPIVAQLLLNRDISSPEKAQRFLAAPLAGLHEPELLPGMEEAVAGLLAAIRDQRRICVYGDYDVDGVTGTAILLTCLTLLGANVEFHVPHRLEEGYGLSSATL